MAIVDLDGRWIRANKTLCTMLGYSEPELVGQPFAIITHPEDRGVDQDAARKLTSGAITKYEREKRYLTKDGETIWVALTVGVVCSETGEPRHFVSQMQDITERRAADERLRQSEARFRLLAEASSNGVTISRNGRLLEVNAAWTRMFGYTEEEARGMDSLRFVPPEMRDEVFHRLANREEGTFEARCIRKDGTRFDVAVTAREATYEGKPARVSVVVDTTAWKRAERLKDELVSTVSHELRTPLTVIRGALGLLAGGTAGPLSEAAANLVNIASANTDRLVHLITDLLDLAKLEAEAFEVHLAPIRADEVVRTAMDEMQPMAAQAKSTLTANVGTGLEALGDHERLVQVLTNFVSNAIKFSPAYSTVEITASSASENSIRFAVHNPGPGISAADVPRLFTRFQQLDGSDAREHGGSGLGLAISKAIVERHGGHVGVDSQPNVKTTFWFEVPAAP